MYRALALVIAVLVLAPFARADDPKPADAKPADAKPASKARPNSIAVMDTVAQGVPDTLAALATQTVTSYLANNLGLDVVAKDDVRKLISFEQQKQLLGCESDACQTAGNIGEALGVERIVTSTLGKIGDRFQVSVVCMDVAQSKVVGRSTREMREESEIVENTRDLAHFVVKKEQRESKGYARIAVSQPGAKIIIDGAEFGVAPLSAPARLLAGRHNVRVEKEGYLPFAFDFEIEAGKESPIEAKLLAKSEITVAGSGYLPFAGATAGLAIVGGALSYYFWNDANNIYNTVYKADTITRSQLEKAKEDIEREGNTYAYYGTIGSSVMGVLSVGLFAAYFTSGLGAGGDAPADTTPAVTPTADGFAVHF